MKKLFLLILFVIKIYLVLNVGQTNDYFLHSYRAWTLINFGRDEIGNVLPILFHGIYGYQLPLTSYLFVPFGGIGFEFLVWLLPAMLLSVAFASSNLGIIFLATPAFIWPGNYGPKLLILIISLIIAALKRKIFLIPTVIFIATIFYLILVSGTPGLKKTFISQNFGLFQSESLITTVNSLRGEHNLPLLARVLHNKFYFVLVYFQNVFSALNPSYLFGFGDKAQKIPPLLIILLPFLFRRPSKLIAGLAVTALILAGFQATTFKVSGHFPLFLALVILAGRNLPPFAIYLGVVLLLPMAYFSAHFLPHNIWVNQGRGLAAVVELAKDNPASKILLSDDIYPNPGPFLAYHLHPSPPITTKNVYLYRNYIRHIGNIEIVSPSDSRLQPGGSISLVSSVGPKKYPLLPIVNDPFGQSILFRLIYVPSE